jgi:delta-aminolevulinic acid dehydratase/porphobilinogen synthase
MPFPAERSRRLRRTLALGRLSREARLDVAGADIIISYHALQAAWWLREE